MKIIIDENISPSIIKALRELNKDPLVSILSVREGYGAGIEDPDWMFRFKDEGGAAMISGDENILKKTVNLAAYIESGLISVWPPSKWSDLKFWGQAALLVRWWPTICERVKTSTSGDRFRIPLSWSPNIENLKPMRDPREF
jgi:PIN like domain